MACRPKTPDAKRAEEALRERIQALDREKRTFWIGETTRIHDLLAAADVVALPSSDLHAKMDLPLVLLEAMWLARPVLVASASPAAELGDDGAALAVDPDPAALADALRSLIDDAERRAVLGERARKAAEARFHPARMAREYEALYDRVLEDR
jgi:glycosyltransferase involved in cell wall biosynthesis